MQDAASEISRVLWVGTTVILFMGVALIMLGVMYQNHFINSKKEEALLLKTSLESEMKVRDSIASDIHDGVLGDLTALNFFFSVIEHENNPLKDNIYYPDLKKSVEHAISNTRQVSYGLMPPMLRDFGLFKALEEYFSRISRNTFIQFIVISNDIKLDANIAYELFRVVQEFATNFIKYGGGSEFKVILSDTGKWLKIEIIDNGITYNFNEKYSSSKGNGLRNICSRLKLINATIAQKYLHKPGNYIFIKLKRC
jgi:signal transduction histidine kinase